MRPLPHLLGALNRVLVANAGSLVGTTAVTSALGFAYWWLAARIFPAEAVGLAAASISAMMLLGTMAVLGLGTLVIGELPRHPGREPSLISTALIVAGLCGAGLGAIFVLLAPAVLADFAALSTDFEGGLVVTLGVTLTGVTLVLDQALVGLLRGDAQFLRNVIFAVTKLGALGVAGFWLGETRGLAIYATWVLGYVVSLAGPAGFAALRGSRPTDYRPKWGFLRSMGRAAFGHYSLNLALQAPYLAVPIVVTATLSSAMNAYFYTAWMMAGLVFTGPFALTTALYAIGARAPELLAQRIRCTLSLSAVGGLLASVAFVVGGGLLLSFFGSAYAEHAQVSLAVLVTAVFPLTIKHHYIAIHRIHGRTAAAVPVVGFGGALELLLAWVGASQGGLSGLSLGWLLATWLEAIPMAPAIYRAASAGGAPRAAVGELALAGRALDREAVA